MNSSSLRRITACFRPALALAVTAITGGCLSGCSSVYVTAPFGEKPHVLVPEKWNGWWSIEKGVVSVQVVNATGGELRLSGIEERDGKQELQTANVFIRESAGMLFASVRLPEMPDGQSVWARLKLDDDQITVWCPAVAKFAALVRAGKLKGRIAEGGDVFLESLEASDYAELASDKYGVLMQWDEPGVLRRLKR